MQNLASFSTSFNFVPPAFENAARYPKSETKVQCCDDCPMFRPSLVKLGLSAPRKLCHFCPTCKIALKKRAKSSITQPWIIQFCWNFVQNLNAWHSKCYKSSRSRGQRSRHDIPYAKICKIINNSAGDCLISLKFRANFDHETLDVPQTFPKVKRSKVKVTVW